MKMKLAFLALCLGLGIQTRPVEAKEPARGIEYSMHVRREDPTDAAEPSPQEAECVVVIEKAKHGEITTDITEGNVGEICTITAKHDALYKVISVKANGAALEEDEETSGVYKFALSAGENVITAKFDVDEELCGKLSNIIRKIGEDDWSWESLFTLDNVMIALKWILDGGLLIALIRYLVKNKKLSRELELNTKKTIEECIPESTKQTVLATTKEVIKPLFEQQLLENAELKSVMSSLVRCIALSQQNTPEAKIAILNELAGIKNVGDAQSLTEIKEYIKQTVESQNKKLEDTMAKLDKIQSESSSIIGEEEKEGETSEEAEDNGAHIDGTQI